MADATLSMRVSRRSMLVGGVAVVAAPVPILPADFPPRSRGQPPDTELLRRIAAAHDCLAAYHLADTVYGQLQETLKDYPDFPDRMPSNQAEGERWDALMGQNGITAAYAHCERLYEHYEAALAAAFALPARTLAGVHGKLQLALTAVKQEQNGVLDPADCTYLDGTLGDLARLAACCAPPVGAGQARIPADQVAHGTP